MTVIKFTSILIGLTSIIIVSGCDSLNRDNVEPYDLSAQLFIDLAIFDKDTKTTTKIVDFSNYTVGINSERGLNINLLYKDLEFPLLLSPGEYTITASSIINSGQQYSGEEILTLREYDRKDITISMKKIGINISQEPPFSCGSDTVNVEIK